MTTFASAPDPAHAAEWCTPVGCVPADLFDPLLVLWTGLLTLALLVALTYLPRATDVCEQERTRTRDEKTAFERFARTVASLDATSNAMRATRASAQTGGVGPGSTMVQATPPPDDGAPLDRVRRAYRESVMAVPHYDEEYDEPLPTNMAVEFGEELAHAVADDGHLTPHLKTALVERSHQSADERASFVTALDREHDALAAATDQLTTIETAIDGLDEWSLHRRSYDDLLATYHHLDGRHDDCQTLLDDRQTTVQNGYPVGVRVRNGVDFHTYLYQPLQVRHPILAETAAVRTDLQAAQDRVATELGRRV